MQRSIAIICAFVLVGCVQIPPEATVLNANVSQSLATSQENFSALATAWGVSLKEVVDANFEEDYAALEDAFRQDPNVPDRGALSASQYRDLAGLYALQRSEVHAYIDQEVARLVADHGAQTKTAIEMNNAITELLASANELIAQRRQLGSSLTNLTGVPVTSVSSKLTNIANAISN